MDKAMFDIARRVIQSAIDSGMEVTQEELAWLKDADKEYTTEKMTVEQAVEKFEEVANRPIQVTIVNDNKELVRLLEALVVKAVPTPIVTLNAPPLPPVTVQAQVVVPETSETITVERDQNQLVKSMTKTRKKRTG